MDSLDIPGGHEYKGASDGYVDKKTGQKSVASSMETDEASHSFDHHLSDVENVMVRRNCNVGIFEV